MTSPTTAFNYPPLEHPRFTFSPLATTTIPHGASTVDRTSPTSRSHLLRGSASPPTPHSYPQTASSHPHPLLPDHPHTSLSHSSEPLSSCPLHPHPLSKESILSLLTRTTPHVHSLKSYTQSDAKSKVLSTLQFFKPTYSPTHTNSPKPLPETSLLISLFRSPPQLVSHTLFTYNSNNGSFDPMRTVPHRQHSLSPTISPLHPLSCFPYPLLFLSNHQSTLLSEHTRSQFSPIKNTHHLHTPPHSTFPSTNSKYTPTSTQQPAKPASNLLPGAPPLGFGALSAKSGADPHHRRYITRTSMRPLSTRTLPPYATLVSTVSTAPYHP